MNSAVADKPRDASVLYAMAWLTPQKTSLATRVIVLTSVLLGQIACASVAALKLGSAGPRSLGTEGVDALTKHASPPQQLLSFRI